MNNYTKEQLIKVLKGLKGPSREVDIDLLCFRYDMSDYSFVSSPDGEVTHYCHKEGGQLFKIPKFTESIDDSLSLIPPNYKLKSISLIEKRDGDICDIHQVWLSNSRAGKYKLGYHEEICIAICIPSIKALEGH